ncbi:hypothetical protein SSBG_00974 [Streptomyces sp. SPB074]|nr:hypothetical protein SSBG_00974 [Streptomyces sp. SPB074]
MQPQVQRGESTAEPERSQPLLNFNGEGPVRGGADAGLEIGAADLRLQPLAAVIPLRVRAGSPRTRGRTASARSSPSRTGQA